MARIPIEIIRIGKEYHTEIDSAIGIANENQDEFVFSYVKPEQERKFSTLNFAKGKVQELIPILRQMRKELKGFHPFTIFVVDGELEDEEYSNLFGSGEPEEGLFILTWNNVPDIIIPNNKMTSYFLFFFARNALNSILPEHYNHYDTRGCVFDFKESKLDLAMSMKSGAMCDDCRMDMLNKNYSMNEDQFNSLNKLFEQSGVLLIETKTEEIEQEIKKKIFIGSSSEGLEIARKIQAELHHEFDLEIWNQGTFDQLGKSFLECLETATDNFDYGVFVFSPDDTIFSRGEQKSIARDNVIFELGLFTGKLTRFKSFIVHPTDVNIHILSDFDGITKAGYKSKSENLKAALGPVCERIRESIKYAT
jgi:predicted nucleotide-binding protein